MGQLQMAVPPSGSDFYLRTRAAKKIIVIDLGFLGDSVHLLPSLWELKSHYPDAQLHVLTTAIGADVLQMAPCVDRAWVFPLGPKSPPWWRHWDIIRALRCEKFDLAINFSGADRTLFLTALTGARWRAAREGARKHFWRRWLIADWVARTDLEQPVYEQRRRVLSRLGLNLGPARFDLRVPETAVNWIKTWVKFPAVHFSINASTPLKEWPLAHWIELARIVLRDHPQFQIVASSGSAGREQERLKEFSAAVNDPGLKTFMAPSLADLSALLKAGALHVGADSGVLHLAMALDVPTLSFFREYPGLSDWLPRGEKHRALTSACACEQNRNWTCAANGVAACLEKISPDAAGDALRKLLSRQES